MADEQLTVAIRAVNEATDALKSVEGDIRKVERAAEDASTKSGGFGKALGDVSKVAGGFVLAGALTAGPQVLGSLTSGARDLELQMKKAEVVFGDQLGVVQAWASGNAAAMGLSKNEAVNLAAGMQDLLVPMGFARDEAAKMSTNTLNLAGALAEWSGGTKDAKEVSDILTKAVLGERDGLKALGISISEAEVKQRLAVNGTDKLTDAALAQATAIATQQLIMEKSTDAQTAFANGAGSAARKQAEMAAATTTAQEELAQGFGPAIATVTALLATVLIPVLGQVPTFFNAIGFAIGLGATALGAMQPFLLPLAAGLGAVGVVILSTMIPAIVAWTIAEWAKVAALTASAAAFIAANAPIIIIAASAALLVAGIVLLVQHWDEITAKVPALGTATDAVKAVIEIFTGWITGTFVPAVKMIGTATVDGAGAAINFVKDHWKEINDTIEPAIEAVRLTVDTAFALIETYVTTTIGVVTGIFKTISALLHGDFSGAWTAFQETVGTAMTGVKDAVQILLDFITGIVPLFLGAGKAVGGALLDGMKDALTGAGGFVSDVASAALQAVKSVINGVIRQFNRAVEFEIVMPGDIPNIHIDPPDIPTLATGGIVRARPGGMLAVIGEGGYDEAVVPLDGRHGIGGGLTVNLTVQGNIYGIDNLIIDLDRGLKRAGHPGLVTR